MEWLKSTLARWKVQVSFVAGALVVATAYGQCTIEPPAEEVSSATEAVETTEATTVEVSSVTEGTIEDATGETTTTEATTGTTTETTTDTTTEQLKAAGRPVKSLPPFFQEA